MSLRHANLLEDPLEPTCRSMAPVESVGDGVHRPAAQEERDRAVRREASRQ